MSPIAAVPVPPVSHVSYQPRPAETARSSEQKAQSPPSDPHGPAVVISGALAKPPRPPEKPADHQGDRPRQDAHADQPKPPQHVNRVI